MTPGDGPATGPLAAGPGSPFSDPAVGAGFAAAYEDALVTAVRQARADDEPAPEPAPEPWPDAVAEPLPRPPLRTSVPLVAGPVVTEQDVADEQADLEARPLVRDGRRRRAPQPARLSPARAVAGAAVSVAGVLLGIGTLLWVTDDPQDSLGPVVTDTAASSPLAQEPPEETEQVPVDPPSPVVVAPPPSPAPPPAPVATAAPTRAPSLVVPITVLNNSKRTGLAERAAARFERGGWPVRLTGNFRGTVPVTTVYYDPGLEASARAFARSFEGIVRVRPRFDTLPARGVVVVLTREFAA